MKKILPSFLIALVLLVGVSKFALADGTDINLTVKNNGDVVYSGDITLLPAGIISINDSSGNPHDTDADSVLSIINTADALSEEFNISNLIYYDMFGAFYLKCIDVSSSPLCDNWQYKVNGDSPAVGMDSKILSGGENVVLYFGDENKIPEPEAETPRTRVSSGGSRRIVLDDVESPPLPPTPPPSNITLEEKPLGDSPTGESEVITTATEVPKKIIAKQKIVKQQKLEATVVNAVTPEPKIIQSVETPKKNWFRRFWEKVFSVF
jgi:hypothetical protein